MKDSNPISLSGFDRILLHVACASRRPSHWRWHWKGIQRELGFNLGLSNCTQRALLTGIVLSFLLLARLTSAQEKPDNNRFSEIRPTRLLPNEPNDIEAQAGATFLARHRVTAREHVVIVPGLKIPLKEHRIATVPQS